VHPAEERCVRPHVACAKRTASVGTSQIAELFSHN
jgi:hypothetical protein